MNKEYKYHRGNSQVKVTKGECSLCGDVTNLQVHHLSYKPEIFTILCKKCHEKIHGHTTGWVQYSTKYGYEDFREEHKKDIIEVEKNIKNFIVNHPMFRDGLLKDNLLMKILYGFGAIRESKERINEYWEQLVFLSKGLKEMEERFLKEKQEEESKEIKWNEK